jgi:copper chaperone CopZ
MEATFIAPDIECAGCAASIEKALSRDAGVNTVVVAVPTRTITIGFEPSQISREQLSAALTDIGFPPEQD